MRKYKYVLFDLDGTLVYSHLGIYSCICHVLKEMGKKVPTEETLRLCIGPSLLYSFTTFFGMDEEEARLATEKYRAQYEVTGVWENEPVDGALYALERLHTQGFVLAMATSKPAVFAKKISSRWGFSPYLKAEVGIGMEAEHQTKADVIAEAMSLIGANKSECLMVGDRKHDVEGARENGIDCALLKTGYAPEEEYVSCAPDYVFASFFELVNFLQKSE